MLTEEKINEFIWELDNHPQILQHGLYIDKLFIPLWILIRFKFHQTLIHHLLDYTSPDSKKVTIPEKIKFLFNAYQHRIKKIKADYIFLSPAIGNIKNEDDIVNKYHNHFINALHKNFPELATLIIEIPVNWHPLQTVSKTKKKYSLAWDFIKVKLVSTILRSYRKNESIECFVNLCHDFLLKHKIDFDIKILKSDLYKICDTIPWHFKTWKQILKKVSPKVIISQDMCYGGTLGALIILFKSLNILLVEDQHGSIDTHVSYSYGNNFIHKYKDMNNHFPSYFLSYGKAWLKDVNFTSEKIVIGNPLLCEEASINKNFVENDNDEIDVLIISNSQNLQETENVTIQLCSYFKNKKFLFRPHPREVYGLDSRYSKLHSFTNLKFDLSVNLYPTLRKTKTMLIIGKYFSTVAYEALFFRKKVIMFLSPEETVIGAHPSLEGLYGTCNTLNDLSILLDDHKLFKKSEYSVIDEFYYQSWENRWLNFVKVTLEK